MAKLIQLPYEITVEIPVETAQAVQSNRLTTISLEALGLLVNLISYTKTNKEWEIHKTELYKRYAENKETSVRSAWKSLEKANYIIEFKYRVGKKWEYVYYFRKVPFTEEEKAKILADAEQEYGEVWGLDFQDLKMRTSKPRGNQNNKLKKKTKYKNSEPPNIDKKHDDDKRASSPPLTDEEELIISVMREETKDVLVDRSFNAVVRKVVDKHKQGKIHSSFRDYLVTALTNKIEELELRRMKDQANSEIAKERAEEKRNQLNNANVHEYDRGELPFYNWLDS